MKILGLVASSATGGRESKRVGSRGERETVGIQKRKEVGGRGRWVADGDTKGNGRGPRKT